MVFYKLFSCFKIDIAMNFLNRQVTKDGFPAQKIPVYLNYVYIELKNDFLWKVNLKTYLIKTISSRSKESTGWGTNPNPPCFQLWQFHMNIVCFFAKSLCICTPKLQLLSVTDIAVSLIKSSFSCCCATLVVQFRSSSTIDKCKGCGEEANEYLVFSSRLFSSDQHKN